MRPMAKTKRASKALLPAKKRFLPTAFVARAEKLAAGKRTRIEREAR